ncbi:hypothetical protein GCM10009839_65860 [Catenulispora yoronensis]|uniref:Uncharacterized protein n=1 Tax=Catenulispora yoronensis TaxID=450799 RepID=A0ABN2V499_9ACTN
MGALGVGVGVGAAVTVGAAEVAIASTAALTQTGTRRRIRRSRDIPFLPFEERRSFIRGRVSVSELSRRRLGLRPPAGGGEAPYLSPGLRGGMGEYQPVSRYPANVRDGAARVPCATGV